MSQRDLRGMDVLNWGYGLTSSAENSHILSQSFYKYFEYGTKRCDRNQL
jgi:hypothetical protein